MPDCKLLREEMRPPSAGKTSTDNSEFFRMLTRLSTMLKWLKPLILQQIYKLDGPPAVTFTRPFQFSV